MGNKNDARKRRKSGQIKFKTRSFKGNKHTNSLLNSSSVTGTENEAFTPASIDTEITDVTSVETASTKKLKSITASITLPNTTAEDHTFHYLIIDSTILQTILDVVGRCPKCHCKDILFKNSATQKKGLSNFIHISCNACDFVYTTYSSKQVVREGIPGQNPFGINARAVVAFREIGKGHSAMESLFGFMNFLPVMGKDSFSEMNKDISASYSKVAKGCMSEAANEVHSGADENLLCDIAVSCDGTWQKRGFSSLLGAVTVISVETGKCLNYEVMSKKCSLCTLWESRKGTEAYEKFINVIRDSHECSINHDGSAGSMEAKGVVECFSTSVDKYNLQYTEYLGDGDSKSYKEVCEADPYGKPIQKLECIGHIQKRVGRKLRNLKDNGVFKDLYNDDD